MSAAATLNIRQSERAFLSVLHLRVGECPQPDEPGSPYVTLDNLMDYTESCITVELRTKAANSMGERRDCVLRTPEGDFSIGMKFMNSDRVLLSLGNKPKVYITEPNGARFNWRHGRIHMSGLPAQRSQQSRQSPHGPGDSSGRGAAPAAPPPYSPMPMTDAPPMRLWSAAGSSLARHDSKWTAQHAMRNSAHLHTSQRDGKDFESQIGGVEDQQISPIATQIGHETKQTNQPEMSEQECRETNPEQTATVVQDSQPAKQKAVSAPGPQTDLLPQNYEEVPSPVPQPTEQAYNMSLSGTLHMEFDQRTGNLGQAEVSVASPPTYGTQPPTTQATERTLQTEEELQTEQAQSQDVNKNEPSDLIAVVTCGQNSQVSKLFKQAGVCMQERLKYESQVVKNRNDGTPYKYTGNIVTMVNDLYEAMRATANDAGKESIARLFGPYLGGDSFDLSTGHIQFSRNSPMFSVMTKMSRRLGEIWDDAIDTVVRSTVAVDTALDEYVTATQMQVLNDCQAEAQTAMDVQFSESQRQLAMMADRLKRMEQDRDIVNATVQHEHFEESKQKNELEAQLAEISARMPDLTAFKNEPDNTMQKGHTQWTKYLNLQVSALIGTQKNDHDAVSRLTARCNELDSRLSENLATFQIDESKSAEALAQKIEELTDETKKIAELNETIANKSVIIAQMAEAADSSEQDGHEEGDVTAHDQWVRKGQVSIKDKHEQSLVMLNKHGSQMRINQQKSDKAVEALVMVDLDLEDEAEVSTKIAASIKHLELAKTHMIKKIGEELRKMGYQVTTTDNQTSRNRDVMVHSGLVLDKRLASDTAAPVLAAEFAESMMNMISIHWRTFWAILPSVYAVCEELTIGRDQTDRVAMPSKQDNFAELFEKFPDLVDEYQAQTEILYRVMTATSQDVVSRTLTTAVLEESGMGEERQTIQASIGDGVFCVVWLCEFHGANTREARANTKMQLHAMSGGFGQAASALPNHVKQIQKVIQKAKKLRLTDISYYETIVTSSTVLISKSPVYVDLHADYCKNVKWDEAITLDRLDSFLGDVLTATNRLRSSDRNSSNMTNKGRCATAVFDAISNLEQCTEDGVDSTSTARSTAGKRSERR